MDQIVEIDLQTTRHNRSEYVFLGFEVVVEGRSGNPRLGGDILHVGRDEPLFEEHLLRNLQLVFFLLVPLVLSRSHSLSSLVLDSSLNPYFSI